MKLNVTGMIYDRMVQNNREAAERDRKRRQGERATAPTLGPDYQAPAHSAVSPAKVDVPEMPEPERLFGDPPEPNFLTWGDLAQGFALFLLAIVVALCAAGVCGFLDEAVKQETQVEVEK